MEVHLLAIQAWVLLITGGVYIAAGLWLGTDPAAIAWRAPLAAFAAMIAARWLLQQVAMVINERVASEMAERQLATEQAAAQAAAQPAPAVQAAQARMGATRPGGR